MNICFLWVLIVDHLHCGGINTKIVYRNFYVVCRWLNCKVLGISHVSSFYNNALHIVHMMMTNDKHFCMSRQLFDTISNVKDRCKTFLPLSVLVTQICKECMHVDDFNNAWHDRVMVIPESVSPSYHASLQIDWTQEGAQHDVDVIVGPEAFLSSFDDD